jgi:hypothetical protein
MNKAKTLRDNEPDPEMLLIAWRPWFCALALGMIGTNVALVTVILVVLSRPAGYTVMRNPFDALCRAQGCVCFGFFVGACVGLVVGFYRRAGDEPRPPI